MQRYKTIYILALASLLFNASVGQNSKPGCDKKLIYEILNLHIQLLDEKDFNQPYFLEAEAYPEYHDEKKFNDGNKYSVVCDSLPQWDKSLVVSRFATIRRRDSIKMLDYSCNISLPKFNKTKTSCVIHCSIHHGEWSAYGGAYYYRLKKGKWVLVDSKLDWIS